MKTKKFSWSRLFNLFKKERKEGWALGEKIPKDAHCANELVTKEQPLKKEMCDKEEAVDLKDLDYSPPKELLRKKRFPSKRGKRLTYALVDKKGIILYYGKDLGKFVSSNPEFKDVKIKNLYAFAARNITKDSYYKDKWNLYIVK